MVNWCRPNGATKHTFNLISFDPDRVGASAVEGPAHWTLKGVSYQDWLPAKSAGNRFS
jgi:hypothetical protein